MKKEIRNALIKVQRKRREDIDRYGCDNTLKALLKNENLITLMALGIELNIDISGLDR